MTDASNEVREVIRAIRSAARTTYWSRPSYGTACYAINDMLWGDVVKAANELEKKLGTGSCDTPAEHAKET